MFDGLTLSRRDDIISMIYVLNYLIDTRMTWVKFDQPLPQQMKKIREFKTQTPAKDFLSKKAKHLIPMLSYAYDLQFEERPDYERLKFMFRKVLMDKDYLPDKIFDWSLRQGQTFNKINRDENHSSISSCDMRSYDDVVDLNAIIHLKSNIDKKKLDYNQIKNQNFRLLSSAKRGNG